MVYPTHGAGSLCSTGIASTSWSTIGYERRHDPLLGPLDVDAFARALLAGQPTFPRYFARMRPINQAGPRLLGGVVPEIRAAVGRRPDGSPDGRGVDRGHAGARGPRARADPGIAVDPGRVVVRDVARLGRGGRHARRPPGRRRRRARRPRAPGVADRLRVDRRVHRGGPRCLAAVGAVGAGRRLIRRRPAVGRGRARGIGGAPRHRCPPGVRVRGRPRSGLAPCRDRRPDRDPGSPAT